MNVKIISLISIKTLFSSIKATIHFNLTTIKCFIDELENITVFNNSYTIFRDKSI